MSIWVKITALALLILAPTVTALQLGTEPPDCSHLFRPLCALHGLLS